MIKSPPVSPDYYPPNLLSLPPSLPKSDTDFCIYIATTYPHFTFKAGSHFSYRPPKGIFLGPPQPKYALLTLHEIGRAHV